MARFRRYALTAAAGIVTLFAAAPLPRVEIQPGGKFGEFRVVNHGAAIRLRSAVEVQRREKDKWVDAHVANLHLTASCAGTVPDCVTLAAGATLQPVPWTGSFCASQCTVNCNLDGTAPSGTYRFAVTSCDRKFRFYSDSFEKK